MAGGFYDLSQHCVPHVYSLLACCTTLASQRWELEHPFSRASINIRASAGHGRNGRMCVCMQSATVLHTTSAYEAMQGMSVAYLHMILVGQGD